jgi:serine/threonine-protein kinase
VIGETVGSYKVVGKLGQGGMGAVYLAEHTLLGKKVAIKVLHPQYSTDPQLLQRFFNEARATTLVKHPGLIDIHDFGQLPGGGAFLIMEFLDGESLASRLKQTGILSLAEILDVGEQLTQALSAAHEKGIVHRDLKPDNVFLLPDASVKSGLRVKVLDFGIAKLDGESSLKTRTGALIGTPTYMSPEQCRGAGQVDWRSDIYSLGCMLFEMICGRRPFVKEGSGEVIAAHIYEQPTPLSALAPTVPPLYERLVAKAMAKRPEQRQQSMKELGAELALLRGTPLDEAATRIVKPPTSGDATVLTTLASSPGEIVAPPSQVSASKTPRRWLPPTVAAGMIAAAVGAFFAFRDPPLADLPPLPATKAADPVPVAAPPPAKRKLHLAVDSQPQGADVFAADGARLGQTPLASDEDPRGGEIRYTLKLAGYRDAEVAFAGDRDGTQSATLAKIVHHDPPPAAPAVAPVKKAPRPAAVPAPTATKPKPVKNGVLNPFDE